MAAEYLKNVAKLVYKLEISYQCDLIYHYICGLHQNTLVARTRYRQDYFSNVLFLKMTTLFLLQLDV